MSFLVTLPSPDKSGNPPFFIPLLFPLLGIDLVFEDEFLLVINKPNGIAVQGGNSIDFNIDLILPFLTKNKKTEKNCF